MRIEFELNREDWDAAVWVHGRRGSAATDPTVAQGRAGCAAAALGLFLWVMRVDGGGWVAPAALVAFGLFVPARLITMRNAAHDNGWAGAGRLIRPTVWEFDDGGVRSSTGLWDATFRWAAFERFVEGRPTSSYTRTQTTSASSRSARSRTRRRSPRSGRC